MIHVAVLALDNVPLSSLALPIDILNAAGVLWNRIAGVPEERLFTVTLVSPGGVPVKGYRSCIITPDSDLEVIPPPDILVIGGVTELEGLADRYRRTLETILRLHASGTVLASICTGAFLLAGTGLLSGKSATTHWGMANLFRERFPEVKLNVKNIIADEGDLITAGGTTAGGDLALYLVRRFGGKEAADRCARVLMLDPYRTSQLPYEIMHAPVDHGDYEILKIQEWIEQKYWTEISVEGMAKVCHLTRRTFERRFKKATGDSPLHYLRKVRIEKAKNLLENSEYSFEYITRRVGYEDPSTFRRMFLKGTGITPGMYRTKFKDGPRMPG